MPTYEDQARAEHQAARIQVLTGAWEDLAREWQRLRVGAETDAVLGRPDTSSNTLADMARQLSTPGLYGVRPHHRVRQGNPGLIEHEGVLDGAGWHTKMQMVQYLTLGAGDMLYRFDVVRDRMTMRLVMPYNVYKRCDPSDPGVALELWELRWMYVDLGGKDQGWRYCWEVFDVAGAAPSHRIHLATNKRVDGGEVGQLGDDVTSRMLGEHAGVYPWISRDSNEPLIPYPHYQDIDCGTTWNHLARRDAYIGGLNACLNWTYTNRNALLATGKYVVTANMEPQGVTVHRDASFGRDPVAGSVAIATKTITPGATDHYSVPEGKTPYLWEIAEGVNLPNLLDYADRYELKQATRWGLNPSDLTRTAANPASAAALMVSDEGKQRFSRQVEPVFRRHDLSALRIAAVVAREGGLGDFPETGYSTQYPAIRPTAQQQQARRDDMEWQRGQGTMSRVDVFMELNPGVTEEDAIAELRRVDRLEALLAKPPQNRTPSVDPDGPNRPQPDPVPTPEV